MSDFHSDYKKQLVSAADALFAAPAPQSSLKVRRRHRRVSLPAAIALGALLLATAAFAASQLIGSGHAVKSSGAPGRERPSASTGVGVPVPGSRRSPASKQLVGISVPDPAGGLPWGMRLVRTTRGLACLQIGRVLDGRLGVLGRDGQFRDDGLFHELPATVLDRDTCTVPNERVLYEAQIPAAGALPGPARSCLEPGERDISHAGLKPCPTGDDRLLAFGLLGPHALSVSYRTPAGPRTVSTARHLGAYLIVLPSSTAHSRTWELTASSSQLDTFPVETQSRVLSTILYRFGNHLCQAGPHRKSRGSAMCTTAIARTPLPVPEIPRGLHTRVALQAHAVSLGYDLELTFKAPANTFDASTAYGVQVTMPSNPACGSGGVSGQTIERNVARDQTVHITEFVDQPPGCHGLIHGRIVLGGQPDALTGPARDIQTIGRFSFELP